MNVNKLFILFFFSQALCSCSFFENYLGEIIFGQKEQGRSIVVANTSVIELTAISIPLGFTPSQILAKPGQTIKLKVVNKLKDMPLIFSVLKKDEDPVVNAFLGMQEGEAKNWLPPAEHRLIKTKILGINEFESIQIQLPDEPGEYAFLSSYPGQVDGLKGVIKVEIPNKNGLR